ncbi:MAG: hypothetical protein HRT61_20005, partial [Ekhidna sp.]|nr:hypothetical protein [Ekhidna sp.]
MKESNQSITSSNNTGSDFERRLNFISSITNDYAYELLFSKDGRREITWEIGQL